MNDNANSTWEQTANSWMDDPVQMVLQLQVHEDLRWARANSELEEQFRGRIIAVCRQQVVAQASSLAELLEQTAKSGRSLEELAIVEYPDPFAQLPH